MTNPTQAERIRLGGATIEPRRNRIVVGKRSCRITSRDMDVLLCLLAVDRKVIARQEILDRVWKDVVVNEEALTLSVSRLRRALGDNPRKPSYIETIPKKGYRLMLAGRVDQPSADRPRRPTRSVSVRWVVVLAALCLIFASLFLVVRQQYELLGSVQTEQPLTAVPGSR